MQEEHVLRDVQTDRGSLFTEPIVAPINARGQVAFYATVLH
jgi:hypothetical protein